eukprot:scaffold1900_cov147-Skeletonema_menzelii.AAC.7
MCRIEIYPGVCHQTTTLHGRRDNTNTTSTIGSALSSIISALHMANEGVNQTGCNRCGYLLLDTRALKILDTGYWILDTGYWILDTGYWILNTEYWILNGY